MTGNDVGTNDNDDNEEEEGDVAFISTLEASLLAGGARDVDVEEEEEDDDDCLSLDENENE